MFRIPIKETIQKIDQTVEVAGWVDTVRSHGKILFIDLRDRSGLLQVVFTPDNKKVYDLAKTLRPEWVVKLKGQVGERPQGMINDKIPTGKVELAASELEVLSQSETPPFEINQDTKKINEEKRMKYRYLDLRTERMRNNIMMRHKVIKFLRDSLDEQGFVEIATPMLTKSTPEGSRDYIVPSRLQLGNFYALPQSPQQFKQLLMTAGFERYFQIAKCLRDEDSRGDRQPEHTQLDLEMSFVEREDVMALSEELLIAVVEKFFPEKHIQEKPFPKISFEQAMKEYKSDKPDLRKDKKDENLLAFCWVIDFPFFEKTDEGKWTFTHNPFSAAQKEFQKDLLAKKNIKNILTSQYDVVLNGFEIGGGSIRNHQAKALEAVFEIMGYQEKEIKEKFGHMLKAFNFGTPPHGGIAWGLDRVLMLLLEQESIREVIAFPKTGDGRDLMMGAPAGVSKEQLKELGIKLEKK